MASLVKLTNENVGVSADVHYFRAFVVGEITADVTHPLFAAEAAGHVVSIVAGALENGGDGTDPLSMKFTVNKNATAIASTDPAFAKTAAADTLVSTANAGTGITQTVLKTDGSATFAKGDVFSVVFDITRTSPETEITSPFVTVGIVYDTTAHSGLPDAGTQAAGNV